MSITSWNPEIIYARITSAYAEAAALTTGVAKTSAPHDTGELARSIRYTPVSPLSGNIGSTAKHAGPQNKGAGAHQIAPIRKKALYNKRRGFGPVRGPVQHPGNPATGYLDKAQAAFPALFITALRKRFLG